MKRGHPYDAGPAIDRALAAIDTAEAFASSVEEGMRRYPSEVRGRLNSARRALRAAKASVDVVEQHRARDAA